MEPTGKTSEEVKIPKLAENRQNWKIYCTKIIEAAATDITDPLGVLAGWQLDDGSYDWECLDAILKWTFYTTVPISILHPIQKLNTAHKIFNYLAKRFHNPNPIVDPCATSANEAKHGMDENSHKEPKESPISESAATEQHADANRDKEDLPSTKDLPNRGTEHVDEEIVGCEDPHTSPEALVKGTSAERAETTTVVLEGAPHKMQNSLQNSLQTTLRLPIEGEQEAVESIVTAGRMSGMLKTVKTAVPTIADVNRTALLGRGPAERASGIGKGDGTEREPPMQLQQIYCKANCQRNRNARENIPGTHGSLLVGEWEVCASGETKNSIADSPSKLKVAEDTAGVTSRGCREGTGKSESVDEADGDAGRRIEPANTPNELEELVTISIEPENLESGGIPCVRLGGTWMQTGDVNGPGCRVDESTGQMDVLDTLNGAETTGISHGDGAEMYLDARDAKCVVHAMDGVGSQTDASSGHGDVPSVEMDVLIPTNVPGIVRIPRKKKKPPNSPMEAARPCSDEPDGCRDHAEGSSARMHGHSVGNETKTTANDSRSVRKRQAEAQTQNSPKGPQIEPPKSTRRWKRVGVRDVSVYLPWNAPVEALGRTFEFGQPESGDEVIAPSIEGETARDQNGDDSDGDDDGGDGIASSRTVNSMRVEGVRLAEESQHAQHCTLRANDLPRSSGPPTSHTERPYGDVRRRR